MCLPYCLSEIHPADLGSVRSHSLNAVLHNKLLLDVSFTIVFYISKLKFALPSYLLIFRQIYFLDCTMLGARRLPERGVNSNTWICYYLKDTSSRTTYDLLCFVINVSIVKYLESVTVLFSTVCPNKSLKIKFCRFKFTSLIHAKKSKLLSWYS